VLFEFHCAVIGGEDISRSISLTSIAIIFVLLDSSAHLFFRVLLIVFVSQAVSADFLGLSVLRSLFAEAIEVGDEGDVTVECFIVFFTISH